MNEHHTILSLGAGEKPRSWRNLSLEDRFWLQCERQPNGCLLWTGAVTGNGYGVIDRRGKLVGAHVVAWETIAGHGPVPAGKELDHLCRSRRCVEPAHLEPVPHRVNVLRGESPSAIAHRSGVCRNGHPKTAENWDARRRRCRVCQRAEAARRYRSPTHCPRGHAYAEHGYRNAYGRQRCGICFPRSA